MPRTKMKFLGQGFQKFEHKQRRRQTGAHTDRQTRPNALPQPHSLAVTSHKKLTMNCFLFDKLGCFTFKLVLV